MTIYEFNILPFVDKYETGIDEGLLLYNHVTKEEVYECYSFDTFFVEVAFDNENSVVEIRSYKTGEMLNKFFGNIEYQ